MQNGNRSSNEDRDGKQTDHDVNAANAADDVFPSTEDGIIASTEDDVLPSVEKEIIPSIEDLSDYVSDTNSMNNEHIEDEKSDKGETAKNEKEETEEEKAARLKEEETYTDMGDFDVWDVSMALVDGTLDEKRMQRLREGFFKLLNGT